MSKDFQIQQDSVNGLKFSIRCQDCVIAFEDDLTGDDLELWQRIEDLLNVHVTELLETE